MIKKVNINKYKSEKRKKDENESGGGDRTGRARKSHIYSLLYFIYIYINSWLLDVPWSVNLA